MNPAEIGVAISTTGDEHRLPFLRQCVQAWDTHLPLRAAMFITVDGDEEACERVRQVVSDWTGAVFRVGQPYDKFGEPRKAITDWLGITGPRLGVAANKNTGLELLMDKTKAEHLFLCDDDTRPLYPAALDKHINLAGTLPHSMVCWGRSRLASALTHGQYAEWNWPRGVLLYQTRAVVEQVGGMDEHFGPGGHEHVEYSRRIFQHGLTPAPYPSPYSYCTRNGDGARALWHAEDMPRLGEKLGDLRKRKRALTSVRRVDGDWEKIERVMARRDGDTSYVPFRAHENGRVSATLCLEQPSRGAGEA